MKIEVTPTPALEDVTKRLDHLIALSEAVIGAVAATSGVDVGNILASIRASIYGSDGGAE